MKDFKKLNTEELERYGRHIIIPEFGIESQEKLKNAKVLVVGAGGLGAPLLLYLAAAGVGTIGIVDYDTIEKSNLQRQVLFTDQDVGKSKVTIAKKRLEALNPNITINIYDTSFQASNAFQIIGGYDIVADGTDNFPCRYLVNDACVLKDKVNVYASIYTFEGQASVFNLRRKDGTRGPNYRDIFPEPPPPGQVPSCAEAGVLGILPGIMGSIQATEVIKIITGIGEPLDGKLFIFDALTYTNRVLKFHKSEATKITGLIDYELFCNGVTTNEFKQQNQIDSSQLKKWIEEEVDFQIIDVREKHEFEGGNIGGTWIPLGKIESELDKIEKNKKVVILCRSGKRSLQAIRKLNGEYEFQNLINLKGGLLAFKREIDPSLMVV